MIQILHFLLDYILLFINMFWEDFLNNDIGNINTIDFNFLRGKGEVPYLFCIENGASFKLDVHNIYILLSL